MPTVARKERCPGSGRDAYKSDGSWGWHCPVCLRKIVGGSRNHTPIVRPHRAPAQKLVIHGTEDEMVVIHRSGTYCDTLYAKCPEHARDFQKTHGLTSWADMPALLHDWDVFAASWKTKYTDED
jgi:hypothetical protein